MEKIKESRMGKVACPHCAKGLKVAPLPRKKTRAPSENDPWPERCARRECENLSNTPYGQCSIEECLDYKWVCRLCSGKGFVSEIRAITYALNGEVI